MHQPPATGQAARLHLSPAAGRVLNRRLATIVHTGGELYCVHSRVLVACEVACEVAKLSACLSCLCRLRISIIVSRVARHGFYSEVYDLPSMVVVEVFKPGEIHPSLSSGRFRISFKPSNNAAAEGTLNPCYIIRTYLSST